MSNDVANAASLTDSIAESTTSIDQTAVAPAEPENASREFVGHANVIGSITFVSRILGMARESIAAGCFGHGAVYAAFQVAFTVPNLFRKLLGEGALSAAFIPLYAQAVKRDRQLTHRRARALAAELPAPIEDEGLSSNDFAAASVNLLCMILLGLTGVGEVLIYAYIKLFSLNWDTLLAARLTMIMLPYLLLVCGTAFLGSILQVHRRFVAITATAVVSNVCLIIAMLWGKHRLDLSSDVGQSLAVRWLSYSVLIAGAFQIGMLLPSLRKVGFRFHLSLHFWTPAVRKMILLTVPVAMSAGVLQISVLSDKGIAFILSQRPGATTLRLFGHVISLPMVEGATQRLNWAQFMYQFPLGVFAIALATAIFPKLSSDAHDEHTQAGDRSVVPDEFKAVLRRGVESCLFIGLPASVGMIVVCRPAVKLLFQHGSFTAQDAQWVALSTAIYSAAIWAFSLQQILNRAYYALHDTTTPLIWGIVNLIINTVVEIPLLWTPLQESGMAVGTFVSFAVQAVLMLWMLDRRCGGLGLRKIAGKVGVMTLASAVMWIVCWGVQHTPIYPHSDGRLHWAMQLGLLMALGGATYFLVCRLLGVKQELRLGRRRKSA